MAYCVNCGSNEPDGNKFCSYCGAKLPEASVVEETETANEYSYGTGESDYSYQRVYQNEHQDYKKSGMDALEDVFEPAVVKKGMGVLCYLGILVIIPILAADRTSEYIRLHVNQGLVLFGISLISDILDRAIFRTHLYVLSAGMDLVGLATFVLMIMGIVSACKGTKKPLPIIGEIQILK